MRKSAGEWERKAEINTQLNKTYTHTSHTHQQNIPHTKHAAQTNPDKNTEERLHEHKLQRTKEGHKWLNIAKQLLGESRNLKTDIKKGLIKALDMLFQIIEAGENGNERGKVDTVNLTPSTPQGSHLQKTLEEHGKILQEHQEEMRSLKEAITKTPKETGKEQQVLENLQQLKKTTKELAERVTNINTASPTYANALKNVENQGVRPSPHFAVIISSDTIQDGTGELLKKVRDTLDAKKQGLQIQNIKQIRDERVVVRCNSREEIERVAQQLRKGKDLEVVNTKNKQPLVVLKNVLSYNTDEDIKTALIQQNKHLMEDLSVEERTATVRYRIKVRNRHENHVIVEVSPNLWRRLTEIGRVYIDVQRVRVMDQSPLVQCSKCLAYGHGRRLCVEEDETCHYCGGSHVQQDCPEKLAGTKQTCINCKRAKNTSDRHAVFSDDCPVRKKFDALARQTIAYC